MGGKTAGRKTKENYIEEEARSSRKYNGLFLTVSDLTVCYNPTKEDILFLDLSTE